MARSATAVIADLLDTIEGLERATEAKTQDQFASDWVLRHAVQRAIEIISEVCRHLPQELLDDHPEVRGPASRRPATCFGTNISGWPTRWSGRSW